MADILKDTEYMQMAISLALKGEGYTSPNPMVGAVIVKDGRIIGQGYHERYGGLHAERSALAACSEDPAGASIYVTLEPCCHHGKQPPCTEAVIASGISRVVVGSPDPNPLVAGKGISILREHGIQVDEGVCRSECDAINPVFFHYITNNTPYVVMKYAMTMDGKIAAYTGESQWITGEEARAHVQRLRHRYTGIMAGIGTVLSDDPLLTCRLPEGKQPVRIICDSGLRIPLDSKLVKTAKESPVIIAACNTDSDPSEYSEKEKRLIDAGCRIIRTPAADGRVDLRELVRLLGSEKIDSVLLEGGALLNWAALEAGIVQRVMVYIAPKLLGGEGAKSPIGGKGFSHPDLSAMLERGTVSHIGDDILIESVIRG